MGSTGASAGAGLPNCGLRIEKETGLDRVVALAGNPNVGKSTVFNSLTGLRQHTGNWPGKTVANAQGKYRHKGRSFILVDIPGTYSLTANSAEEEVARDFLCFGGADAVVVVADATCLERNLNLVMQATEITDNIVLCVNLMDEAEKKKISIDLEALRSRLGIPVVGTSARSGRGLAELMDAVWDLTEGLTKTEPVRVDYGAPIESAVSALEGEAERLLGGRVSARWASLKLLEGDENLLAAIREHTGCDLTEDEDLAALAVRARSERERAGIGPNELTDAVVTGIIGKCELIAKEAVTFKKEGYSDTDRKIDRVLTSKLTGIPVMAALLFLIFWLTISGANIPSGLLSKGLFALEGPLGDLFVRFRAPGWLRSAAVDGVYRTIAWVVSVMLPRWPFSFRSLRCSRIWLSAAGGIQSGQFLQEGGSARQAETKDVHGFRVQRRRCDRLPHYRLAAGEADRDGDERVRALQREVSHAGRSNRDVFRGGGRHFRVSCADADTDRRRDSRRRHDAFNVETAFKNRAERAALVV